METFPQQFEKHKPDIEKEPSKNAVDQFAVKWGADYIKENKIVYLPDDYIASIVLPWQAYLTGKEQTQIPTPLEKYGPDGLVPEALAPELRENLSVIDDKIANLNMILQQLYKQPAQNLQLEQQMLEAYEDLYSYFYQINRPLLYEKAYQERSQYFKQRGIEVTDEWLQEDTDAAVLLDLERRKGSLRKLYIELDEKKNKIKHDADMSLVA